MKLSTPIFAVPLFQLASATPLQDQINPVYNLTEFDTDAEPGCSTQVYAGWSCDGEKGPGFAWPDQNHCRSCEINPNDSYHSIKFNHCNPGIIYAQANDYCAIFRPPAGSVKFKGNECLRIDYGGPFLSYVLCWNTGADAPDEITITPSATPTPTGLP
ncbi:hypothetical protein F4819DRAFT_491737 [Hypoxylon fuscum]|nr:hypothetical protein F4819DRAFT_491737 [Hypoxylon fuscum]